MCGLGADNRLIAAQQQADAEDVRGGSVEYEVRRSVAAKHRAKPLLGGERPRVRAVRRRSVGVGFRHRSHHRWVGSGMVVTREVMGCSHSATLRAMVNTDLYSDTSSSTARGRAG